MALILAGGRGERLGVLAEERTKPALPFAGKYRVIDFTLSNCINSGIHNAAVLTQYQPVSLIDHIGFGAAWGFSHIDGSSIRILQPYLTRKEERGWYKGTADAIYQNLQHIEEYEVELILVLSGDHVYTMNYAEMVRSHREKDADITLATIPLPYEDLQRFGTVTVDEEGRVTDFQEKSKKPESNLVSMGIYLFKKDILEEYLAADAQIRSSKHDFGRNMLPAIVSAGKHQVFAYPFNGYWRDIGTVHSYWQANMDLLEISLPLLFGAKWPIRTSEHIRPPALISNSGDVANSLITSGCVVEGKVEHSILSPGVKIAEGALVKDSIVFADTIIGPHSEINYAIVDKEVVVGVGCHIGSGDNFQINRREPRIFSTGITVIGKRAEIPPGVRMGRNCVVACNVRKGDFLASKIPSGDTVRQRRRVSAQKTS